MQQFKTRLRLMTEKLGGTIDYESDGSLLLTLEAGRVHFRPLSHEEMQVDISIDGDVFSFAAPKTHCFDVVHRLTTPHLAAKLKQYVPELLIELSEYINDEQAGDQIADLKRSIASDPSLVCVALGGNRWVAEYFHGYLILTDDLCHGATNIVKL